VLVYLPHLMPPYVMGLLLGIGSGAAMIPYTIIKEVNPDDVKGSATGAINFVVFAISALIAPAYGWLLMTFRRRQADARTVFQDASWAGIAGIVLAIVLSCFLRETGRAAGRPRRSLTAKARIMSDRVITT
jgi:MFS family permease